MNDAKANQPSADYKEDAEIKESGAPCRPRPWLLTREMAGHRPETG